MKVHNCLNKYYIFKKRLSDLLNKYKNNERKIEKINHYKSIINKKIKEEKDLMYEKLKINKAIRFLDPIAINKKNIISVFESTLTRTIGAKENELITDIMVVQTYFFDVIKDIIYDGYMYNNEKYVCLTASAGQIRTKKTVFIKEKLLLKHQDTLMCGLTPEHINKHGGVNINKYLAYLALCNSATDVWEDFDIKKSIVVDDMETMVKGIVDFIDDTTYEITRKEMEVPITHTDGCGMILPKKSRKSFMCRLPWVKGLLVPFSFDMFIRIANEKDKSGKNHGLVKDIYGKEHDILKENIEVIFTKSQFKMYKFYKDWNHYISNYEKYKCQAGKCNEEENEFENAKLNYQMLQTLTDMTDDEIKTICKRSIKNIMNIGRDRKTMLKVLGVTKANINKNNFQQALEIYPELLNDTYSKEILKQVKKSLVKEGRSAKLDIDGKYTFICPDLYAFCEYLFLGNKNPDGLLKNGEVYCKLYKNEPKLDCLRSPHLYREHAIRSNIIDEEKNKWFITKGLYTSCHDLISKILQFDNDGDKSLVCSDHTIIEVAERHMKDIAPLYYNMRKAGAEILNNHNIYNGLKTAYTGGNIGMISNDITKIWNSDNVNLDVIKLLCMENNFTIDYAKTLYKPIRPKEKKKIITDYTKLKVPHFFIYAKDKHKKKVEKINNSVVNKLEKIIPNPKISFKATNLGKFNYKMLMNNKNIEIDDKIIKKYKELDLKSHFMINKQDDEESNNIIYLYQEIKNKILEVNDDVQYVTDVLVEYLYKYKKSNYKTTLWECFGDVIVNNIKQNILEGYILCDKCGKRVEISSNNRKYCSECWKEINKEQTRERVKKHRNNKNVTV